MRGFDAANLDGADSLLRIRGGGLARRANKAGGFTVLELLVGIVLIAGLVASITSSFRALVIFHERAKLSLAQETTRAILKDTYSAALSGAGRFLPAPIFEVDRTDRNRQALIVADIAPEYIYQRVRTAPSSPGSYCRIDTGLPHPDTTDHHIALAIGLTSRWITKLTETSLGKSCSEGRLVKLVFSSVSTPLKLDAGAEQAETVLSVHDIYSLSLDSGGALRRRSFVTGENQIIWNGLRAVSLDENDTDRAFTVSYTAESKLPRRGTITIPFPLRQRTDWLDLIW